MTPFPALVLVHGAWHGPWAFRQLTEQLRDVEVHTVALPSAGSDPAALGDLHDDAAAVAAAVAAVEGPVVVLAHSYGGQPVSQGVSSDANVRRLIYLAAFQLDVGEAAQGTLGDEPVPGLEVHPGSGGYFKLTDPVPALYGDVEPDIARQAVEQLRLQSFASVTQPLTRAAWRHHPSTYIVCEADAALPPAAQETMAKRADRVRRIRSAHSPFLSQPVELAALIREELTGAGSPPRT